MTGKFPPRRGERNLALVLAVALGFVTAGLALFTLAQDTAVPVSVVRVASAPVYDEIPLSGTVVARRFVRVSPRVEGYIQRVLVDAGDEVAAGDVILELDKELAGIELERIRAALGEARIRYEETVRQRNEAKQLVSKNHIAGTEVATAEAEVAINRAGVERLSAELRRQQAILNRHTIDAPFAGVVAAKLVEIDQRAYKQNSGVAHRVSHCVSETAITLDLRGHVRCNPRK